MRLTAEHVQLVHREMPDEGPPAGSTVSTDEDYAATTARLLSTGPDHGDILVLRLWLADLETGLRLRRGPHRRGARLAPAPSAWAGTPASAATEQHPGLMLALDHGGACKGVAYRLPPDAVEANLKKLLQREMGWKPRRFRRAGSMW